MLSWAYLFSYSLLICLSSLLWVNRSLFQLLFITEVITALFFCLGLVLASYYNLYFLFSLGLVLLIMGGLELALAFILLI